MGTMGIATRDRLRRCSACPRRCSSGLIAGDHARASRSSARCSARSRRSSSAATVSPELALVVVGGHVVIQLVEGNVLVPLVMRNTIGISPLIVI